MKPFSDMSTTKHHSQAGVIITLFALALPVLIGLLALAIDCGYLYLARSRLTKVARVSSATALNMMALRGWGAMVAEPEDPPALLGLKTADIQITNDGPRTSANQLVLEEIRRSAIDSLALYYPKDFNPANPESSSDYFKFKGSDGAEHNTPQLSAINRMDSSVQITFRYAVRTYLMGAISQMLGGSGPCVQVEGDTTTRCWVESLPPAGATSGRLKSANVFMLLDVSGSMNEIVRNRTKSSRLVEAAANFIDMFNPYHDRFAVIPYATTADTGNPPVMGEIDRASEGGFIRAKTDIERLAIGGQTNQCDALIQVIRSIEASPTLRDPTTPKFVLLFTDGAPNVYRLGFCGNSACTPSSTPSRLQQALQAGARSIDEAETGWYGWTVKWDRREVFRISEPHDTCPNNGIDVVEGNPRFGSSIPECDPVWAFPRVVSIRDGNELSYETVSQRMQLNEDGEFILLGAPFNGLTLAELGYQLLFKDWQNTELGLPDYQHPDAYKWNGPSYLVHGSFPIPRGIALIDRIPKSIEAGISAITCGPGSRAPFPGHVTTTAPYVADKYNHSRYFASRVVDQEWRWNARPNDRDSTGKANKTGLTFRQRQVAPAYFAQPHTINGNPHDSPGCLSTLHSKIPFSDAQIHVGDNFVSNRDRDIIARGEVVKTAELPYYCALRAADWLRSEYNVVIFVVGLGQEAEDIYGLRCEDPLQNALDFNSRKDRFLTRLAFAPESISDPVAFVAGEGGIGWSSTNDFRFSSARRFANCNNHPLAGLTMEVGYSEEDLARSTGFSPGRHGFTPAHLGAYYGASNPDDLKLLFGEIAKRMLLRLAT